jgi:hypothetical protein
VADLSNSPSNFSIRNHYVPQWYQRRFFERGANQSQLFYLDKTPDVIRRQPLPDTTRRAVRKLGPVNCFAQDHLYTLVFGRYATDVVEKEFFGSVDTIGEMAVAFFSDYDWERDGCHEAAEGMFAYLGAQLFRTPKGLAHLRHLSKSKDHQRTLHALRRYLFAYQGMWTEGVWEVLSCAQSSSTKFIVSDTPVTTYNKGVFPASQEVLAAGWADIGRLGTHTIFPIDLEHCLVVTNLQYVRNPKCNVVALRENARHFGDAMFDLRKVQRRREISEQEVLAINLVLKTMARRYVAAARREWLYPEAGLQERTWSRLGGKHFLMPDPRLVSFTTSTLVGFKDGGAWGTNEYGHQNPDDPRAIALRKTEWHTFQAHKRAWDERDRVAGRQPPVITVHDL